jgi:hypothetical protein
MSILAERNSFEMIVPDEMIGGYAYFELRRNRSLRAEIWTPLRRMGSLMLR